MGPQEMCDLVWSLALFSHTPPPDWMAALERALEDRWVGEGEIGCRASCWERL
jgi:hypothetical protein